MIRNWFRNFYMGTLTGDKAPRAARQRQNKKTTSPAEINAKNAEFWARQPAQIEETATINRSEKSWAK